MTSSLLTCQLAAVDLNEEQYIVKLDEPEALTSGILLASVSLTLFELIGEIH